MTTPSTSIPIQSKTSFRPAQQLALPLICSALFLLPVVGSAQIITYVGSETGSPANDYSVQNWSNPGVAKTYDIGGSEVYGSAGYYQIRPTLNSSPSNVDEPVGAGNDLGILAVSNTTLFSLPSFLSSATGAAGTFVNTPSIVGRTGRPSIGTEPCLSRSTMVPSIRQLAAMRAILVSP